MHDAAVAAINALIQAVPTALSELDGTDFTLPAGTGRLIVLYDPDTLVVKLGRELDPGGSYVAIALLGQAEGVAPLDPAGHVVQAPASHVHGIAIQDNGGTVYNRPVVNLKVVGGTIADNPGANRLDVDLKLADAFTIALGGTAASRQVTNDTALVELTSWTLPLVVGDAFDFEIEIEAEST